MACACVCLEFRFHLGHPIACIYAFLVLVLELASPGKTSLNWTFVNSVAKQNLQALQIIYDEHIFSQF